MPSPDDTQASYRETAFRETCVVCREQASRRCVQCARSFCSLHGPDIDGICADCGLELGQQQATVRSTRNGVSAVLGLAGVVGTALVGPLAAVLGGVGIALAQGVGVGVERLRRHAFERRRRLEDHEAIIDAPQLGLQGGPRRAQRKVGLGRPERPRKRLNFKVRH